jgi:hypothetical protein
MTLTPGAVLTRSPFLGEHAEKALRSAGMDEQAIRSVLDRTLLTWMIQKCRDSS